MWIPAKVLDWFESLKESSDTAISINIALVNDLRQELTAVKTERDILRNQLLVTQTNFDWLRMKVNQLEMERAALMSKAYDIQVPAPEIARTPIVDPTLDPKNFSFEDLGDSLAKKFGYPAYDDKVS